MTAVFRTGSGRISLDFIRTLRWRGTDRALEELATPEALTAWVTQLGPYAPGTEIPTPTQRTLHTAQEAREAVYLLLKTARETTPADCPPGARALLNNLAATPPPHPVLDEHGALTYAASDPVGALLAGIARDALDLATSPLLA
jgi:hypothetical protein